MIEFSEQELFDILLTIDGKGKEVKLPALNELLDRAREKSIREEISNKSP